MFDAKVALAKIANRVPNTNNTNEGWVVKKMRLEYANRIVAILPIIYQKDKVKYFSDEFAMMIFRANHGESIMYFQLAKELIDGTNVRKI